MLFKISRFEVVDLKLSLPRSIILAVAVLHEEVAMFFWFRRLANHDRQQLVSGSSSRTRVPRTNKANERHLIACTICRRYNGHCMRAGREEAFAISNIQHTYVNSQAALGERRPLVISSSSPSESHLPRLEYVLHWADLIRLCISSVCHDMGMTGLRNAQSHPLHAL